MAQATSNLRLTRARQGQRGFAMLLVFLMASVVAITLYMELPRVAMETERAKEQLLIDRGEQYKRAIQLFTKSAKRYPGDLKELESFQNRRFLRHRYIDPMTGKDEWRLIHIQNGVLSDSKLSAPKGPGTGDEKKDTTGQFIGVENSFANAGGNPNAQGGAATVRDRRRPGEGSLPNGEIPPVVTATGVTPPGGAQFGQPGTQQFGQPGTPQFGQPGGPQFGQPGAPQVPQLGGAQFGQPGTQQFGQPGSVQPFPGLSIPGQPANIAGGRQQPGTASTGNSFIGVTNSFATPVTPNAPQPNLPGQIVYPGQPLPGQPGAPVNSQFQGAPAYPGAQVPPGQFGSPYPTTPGANGFPPGIQQPGAAPGAPNQTAADLIGRILTTPRPGGMPNAQPGAQTIGGGIAGVASTAEGEGIMVYNDRTLYQEWEFIFDPQKQKQIQNPNGAVTTGTPAQQLGTPAGGQPGGQPGMNQQSPFGAGTTPRPPGR